MLALFAFDNETELLRGRELSRPTPMVGMLVVTDAAVVVTVAIVEAAVVSAVAVVAPVVSVV